jgi:hypothetical protein
MNVLSTHSLFQCIIILKPLTKLVVCLQLDAKCQEWSLSFPFLYVHVFYEHTLSESRQLNGLPSSFELYIKYKFYFPFHNDQ